MAARRRPTNQPTTRLLFPNSNPHPPKNRCRLRTRLRGAREALALRRRFVQAATAGAPLLPRAAAVDAAVRHLERATNGLSDLLAATQKALAAADSQSLVPPAVARALRLDLSHIGTLAVLLSWRTAVERRRRAQEEAEEERRQWQQWRQQQRQQLEGAPPAAAAADAVGGGGGGMSRGVQTEGGLGVRATAELVAAFRALADGGRAAGDSSGGGSSSSGCVTAPRACVCSLNLLLHFLSLEAEQEWGADDGGGGAGEV